MALVALFPVIYAIVIHLQAYSRRLNEGFARLDNYVEALTDERFWTALQFTVVFTVTSVAAEFGSGSAPADEPGLPRPRRDQASILVPWSIPDRRHGSSCST